MTHNFEFSDDDFEEVGRDTPTRAPVAMRVRHMGKHHVMQLQVTMAPEIVSELAASRVRIEWNRVAAAYRLRGDDTARYQINSFARSQARWIAIPFPKDDLYDVPGLHPAEFRLLPEHRTLIVKVPAALLTPPEQPRQIKAPDHFCDATKMVPALADPRPQRHPGAPLDDPKVVAAALGLATDPAPQDIGGQHFAPAEAEIVRLLATRERVTAQMIMLVTRDPANPDEDDRNLKVVDVYICKVRPKLKALGITVETVWGAGFALSSAHRAKLKTFIDQARGV